MFHFKPLKLLILFLVLFSIFSSKGMTATYSVINCNDSGPGSLRNAMLSLSNGDEIIFDISTIEAGFSSGEVYPGLVTGEAGGNKWFRIIITSSLPTITSNNVCIDGSYQAHEANNMLGPKVEIRGKFSGWEDNLFTTGDNVIIKNLILNRCGTADGQNGALICINADYCQILNCYIGITASGEGCPPLSSDQGIYICPGAQFNKIGDRLDDGRNIISGNKYGIYCMGNSNEVTGNFIGTDRSGNKALPNKYGVFDFDGNHNIIGGTIHALRNIISGNDYGLYLSGNYVQILGNYIGTSVDGNKPLMNYTGVMISDNFNMVGNGGVGGRNIICSNGTGIQTFGNNISILGNYIGIDVNGNSLGNKSYGIILGGRFNKVGDVGIGNTNVISNNEGIGIVVPYASTISSHEIIGNYIGVSPDGQTPMGNGRGVSLGDSGNLIKENIIANNNDYGILAGPSTYGNKLLKNSIYANSSKGISLNDGNKGIKPPLITKVFFDQGTLSLEVFGTSLGTASIEVFIAISGQGKTFISEAIADAAGNWDVKTTFTGLYIGDCLVATQTDQLGDTSEFSDQKVVTNMAKDISSVQLDIPGMNISIPAGAATADATITVADISNSPPGTPPVGFKIGGKIFSITSTVTQFSMPVIVTIPIDGPLNDPHVYYWNGANWSTSGITLVSCTNTSLVFTTTHFSVFAPMGALSNNLIRFGPNPFNPNNDVGHFWYWLEANKDTSLYLVDLGGTILWKQSFVSGTNGGQVGENNIAYDGKTSWGDLLSSGAYAYKIVQDGKSIGGGKIAVIK